MPHTTTTPTFMKTYVLPLFLLLTLSLLTIYTQAQRNVSLVLSDNYTKAGYEALEKLQKRYPALSKHCTVRLYSPAGFLDQDLGFLESSDLIFAYVHQAAVFEMAKGPIVTALKHGAKVYALGGTPAEGAYRQLGVQFNPTVLEYYDEGSVENIMNMILYRLHEDYALPFAYQAVAHYPDAGIYALAQDTIYSSFDDFLAGYKNYQPGNPWVGLYSFRYEFLTGQHQHIDTHITLLEREGFNVLPFFGFPLTESMSLCEDTQGNTRLNFLVTTSFLPGSSPEKLRALFEKMNIPVIHAIQTDQSQEEWAQSKEGLSVFTRTTSLSRPELIGEIQPIITGTMELVTTPDGKQYIEKRAITPRVMRLVNRIKAWHTLQQKPNQEKQIAMIYYNYPPGKENIGASYLNVMPQSMHQIIQRLGAEGYDVGKAVPDSAQLFHEVMDHGRNVGNWAPAEINRLVQTGKPILIPVSLYETWFHTLSKSFQQQVTEKWGAPADCKIMTWKDADGKMYFVLPAVRLGKLLLTPQPVRGWGQDIEKMYHDVTLPPHHQYIAFYLYLKRSFHADALIHLGTHGTHEWLNGKEVGLNDDDAPEALIDDLVNLYPYIVDDVGEGLQAKRRGMAIVIDHLTPPFDKASLNPELHELFGVITEYTAAREKSGPLAQAKLSRLTTMATKQGLLKDLGLHPPLSADDIEKLEHYIKEVDENQTPFGLHTFGQSPDAAHANKTAIAIVDRQPNLAAAERTRQIADLTEKLRISGQHELDALVAGLNGTYIAAGKGNDPLRNPESLPTGKNFYAFDPAKIPAQEVYDIGSKLADELVSNYRAHHHDSIPDKVTMNLWSVETIRHEGIMESQIMRLLGVQPVFNAYGRVTGVKAIPRSALERPRIDVVMIPSGLYRDLFSNLMDLLDEAVTVAAQQDEADNYIRQHMRITQKLLLQQGMTDKAQAERLSLVRMFSTPPGAYGTGVDDVIQASDTWEKDSQVTNVYFNRMSHLYGQGFHGDQPETTDPALAQQFSTGLLKQALAGTKAVVHSRSSNLYGALDNDDFFQYLGATAMAVRAVDGHTPEVTVTNLSDPNHVRQESLDKYLGREMQSRYLNPKWINEMLDEGYAGARMINNVAANLWGWQVTVPEAVDETKWQQFYETYVEDKYDLDIQKKFSEAQNTYAYQSLLARMLEVVRKDYWHPDQQVIDRLTQEYLETVKEVDLACNGNVCNNAKLTEYLQQQAAHIPDVSAEPITDYQQQLAAIQTPPATAQPVPDPEQQVAENKPNPNSAYQPKVNVQGYEMEAVATSADEPLDIDAPVKWGLVLLGIAFLVGFASKRLRP